MARTPVDGGEPSNLQQTTVQKEMRPFADGAVACIAHLHLLKKTIYIVSLFCRQTFTFVRDRSWFITLASVETIEGHDLI